MKKRIGVFVFYDKDGIVSDYVPYLLNDLKQNLDRLVVVCNGKLSAQGRNVLEKIADDVYVHENKGFDAAAYKEAFENIIGWDQLVEYDELVMCNDTFYGPFWPFQNVFDEMERTKPKIDFWGLTVHGKAEGNGWQDHKFGYLPEHLQSFFLVVRNRLLSSREFHCFWNGIRSNYDSVDDVIDDFETSFTKTFEDAGFSWAAYCDTRNLDGNGDYYTFNHTVYNCEELIRKYRCPIIKRRAFTREDVLIATDGGNSKRAVEYIKRNSKYDISMIYQHLLRLYNPSLLKQSLDLDFVLPTDVEMRRNQSIEPGSVLVIFHIYYKEFLEETFCYLQNLPPEIDVLLTTNNPKIVDELENRAKELVANVIGIRQSSSRGRDISALLLTAKDEVQSHQYVCFTHDKKTTKEMRYYTIGRNFQSLINENVLASEAYVRNILGLFQDRADLGVLVPPPPYWGAYGCSVGNGWQNDFEVTQKLLLKLGIHTTISPSFEPITLGTSLWFRSDALTPLFQYPWTEQDFVKEPMPADGTVSHAIERVFPYVAQSMGYTTAWGLTPFYAELYIEQYQKMLSSFLGEWAKNKMPGECFDEIAYSYRNLILSRASGKNGKGNIWGAKEAFLAWDPDLIRAAELAERHEEVGLNTIGFTSAWSLFCISLGVWRKKHSLSKLSRRMGEFMAAQKMPSVQQSWWLVRKTFGIWIKKL